MAADNSLGDDFGRPNIFVLGNCRERIQFARAFQKCRFERLGVDEIPTGEHIFRLTRHILRLGGVLRVVTEYLAGEPIRSLKFGPRWRGMFRSP